MKIHGDPIWEEAVQQQVFRALLSAMSRPGQVAALPEQGADHPPYLLILAALVDGTVCLADPDGLVEAAYWPLLETKRSDVSAADFVLLPAQGAVPGDFQPQLGDLASPEKGATLILVVEHLGGESGTRLLLSGPGVDPGRAFKVTGLHPSWLDRRQAWNRHFPLGVDLILADKERLAAIPRTTTAKPV